MHVININTSMNEFASVMADMRIWLDDRRISPDHFNHSSPPNGMITITVYFGSPADAAAFAERFGGTQRTPALLSR